MPFFALWILILTGVVFFLYQRVKSLEDQVKNLGEKPVKETPKPEKKPVVAAEALPEPEPQSYAVAESTPKPPPVDEPAAAEPSRLGETLEAVLSFLRGGNAWVAVGIAFLVLGFAFAYIYIAQRYHIPGGFKVGAGVLAGLALFALGWKKRHKRRSFALIVQGGGIGIIYLSVFAAAKIYDLLPFGAAFLFLVLTVGAVAVLSVLQDSQPMAFFAAVTGFAAPVLLSEDSGNFIGLYSYYMLLNLGILASAFRRYWRYLNGAGFLFTYAVGLMWGMKYYTDSHFVRVEIFTVAFFLLFTALNVLCCIKYKKDRIENVFAVSTPFVFMLIQFYITSPFKYGQAIASFAVGLFYFLLTYALFRKYGKVMVKLTTLYLAMGIVFLNFSAPLALPGDWTAGIWACEGAILVILGVWQGSRFFRWFGLLLAAGGAYAAWSGWRPWNVPLPFINSWFITRLLASVGMLASAGAYHKLKTREGKILSTAALALGAVLWPAAFAPEIYAQTTFPLDGTVYLMLAGISALLFCLYGRRLEWRLPQIAAFLPPVYLFFMTLPHLIGLLSFGRDALFLWSYMGLFTLDNLNWPGWLVFIACWAWLMKVYRQTKEAPVWAINAAHATMLFGIALMMGINIQHLWNSLFLRFAETPVFFHGIMEVCLIAAAVIFITSPRALKLPPVADYPNAYRVHGAGALSGYLLFSMLYLCTTTWQTPGSPALPLINTIDAASALCLLSAAYWSVWFTKNYMINKYAVRAIQIIIGSATFIWLHALAGRAVFWFTADPLRNDFTREWLYYSGPYQVAVAVIWGVTGFVLMTAGYKTARRPLWVTGAALLVCDAVKLLLIDLSRAGTLARVASFMAVGLIFIAIGYFMPLPPKKQDKNNEAD